MPLKEATRKEIVMCELQKFDTKKDAITDAVVADILENTFEEENGFGSIKR
jgi:hypothetical protein